MDEIAELEGLKDVFIYVDKSTVCEIDRFGEYARLL